MNKEKTQTETCVGKWCTVNHNNHLLQATIVDFDKDTPLLPKRIRIQTKGKYQGIVLGRSAYIFCTW